MPARYQHPPFGFLPATNFAAAGYTQRLMRPIGAASYSGQYTLQTYMTTVEVIVINDTWLHVLSDAGVRTDLKGAAPYNSVHLYTISLSSPDGDLPYKKGDQLIPTGSLIGLVANTTHPIRGVQAYPTYAELIVETKL